MQLKRIFPTLCPFLLLLPVLGGALGSCSQYDTDTVGQKFVPVNSQVRSFTHPVYVEYTAESARVWGPYATEVEQEADGLNLRLNCASDSLALIVYGYPSQGMFDTECRLTISSSRPYALYLNGLTLSSHQGPALSCLGEAPCYMVLPQKSKNQFHAWGLGDTERGDACLYAEGQILLSGAGELSVINHTEAQRGSRPSHAISAAGLQCQYKVKVELLSLAGDGIHVERTLRCSDGTWNISAQRNGISAGDSIVLYNGSYTGYAADGAFLWNDLGAVLRMPTLTAASGWNSSVLDSLSTTLLFDSVQAVWQEQFADTLLLTGSIYTLIDTLNASVTTLKPTFDLPEPYVLISNAKVHSDMPLRIK